MKTLKNLLVLSGTLLVGFSIFAIYAGLPFTSTFVAGVICAGFGTILNKRDDGDAN